MPRVLIGAATLRTTGGPFRDVFRDGGFEVVWPAVTSRQMTEDELLSELANGIDATLAGSETYTRRVLDARPQLKVIARNGVGYDAVDVPAATDHGIPVTVAPANDEAVAEHAFALILTLAKKVIPQHDGIRRGEWLRQLTRPLRTQTLGVAGLGRIGRAVAVRGRAFGMTVIAHEPYPDAAFVQRHAIELLPLEQLFERSDYISLHLPLSPESKGVIDRRFFARMKPTAYIVNTARGPVINEADLVDALKTNRIAGAGLDVFEVEPPGLAAVTQLENVVMTAHTAGVDAKSGEDMATLAAQTIVRLSRGDWPDGLVVNPSVKDKFKWTAG
jgi:D-3-phosphoglycerate dehydrogenase / 2-oxoglutarate reductase